MAMDDHHCFSDFFEEHDPYTYSDTNNLSGGSDDLFSILESLDGVMDMEFHEPPPVSSSTVPLDHEAAFVISSSSKHQLGGEDLETELETSPKTKRLKLSGATTTATTTCSEDGQQRMSHITVERNRRKQMNEHLTVLRSLMPCFYVKRGDQASIIGGVVDYINELQQVLQSLEAKKQRKVYSEVLSPRVQQAVSSSTSSPRLPSSPLVLSPRKPPLSPLSPRPLSCTSLPISPRTPQPTPSARLQQPPPYLSSPTNNILAATTSLEPSPASSTTTSSIDNVNDLSANSKSTVADVEVKFSGPNVLLKTVSPRIPGQALRIISALQDLQLEILHVSITTMDDTMRNSFTIKIGIECKLSAEELAHQVQQTFCYS